MSNKDNDGELRLIICLILSGAYFFAVFHFFGLSIDKIKGMEPNEIGDFFAGIFSPLAFFFLIVGYIQNTMALRMQSQELKASTDALKQQVTEMKESVDQQKIMAQLQQAELEDRHNSVAPVITFQAFLHIENNKIKFRLIFTNQSDNPARHITIEHGPNLIQTLEVFPKDHRQDFYSDFLPVEDGLYRANNDVEREIKIEFENILGRKYEHKYKIRSIIQNENRVTLIERIS
ncbi:hypothetical protein [Acinetobacter baumannii]|uniref:hypothetical protein n=1 Tax=Acinetobacter baumannii TaxID=470 RepID=UPI003A87258F